MWRPMGGRLMGGRKMNWAVLSVFLGGLLVAACEGGTMPDIQDRRPGKSGSVYGERDSKITGEGGISFGGPKKRKVDPGGGGIGVNSFLWRASLDTISFMPVNSADPFGGVIITDWHSQAESPSERFKMNVYILGRSLRADGVRVAVFRQVKGQSGGWLDAPISKETGTRIEDAILTKARRLRNETLQQ